jgi:hypothetical protein
MMSETHMFDILRGMFNEKYLNNLRSIAVFDTEDGYELFGEYNIHRRGNRYVVTKQRTDLERTFFNLRNAVLWVTLYKRDKVSDARRLADLDSILEGSLFNIQSNLAMLKKARNDDEVGIYAAKLSDNKAKVKVVNDQLSVFERDVRSWQYAKYKTLTSAANKFAK